MISKSIGLALWVLCTAALYVIAVLAYRRAIKADRYVSTHQPWDERWDSEISVNVAMGMLTTFSVLGALASTGGLVGWLMTGGLGI